jgi:hypothetical protein
MYTSNIIYIVYICIYVLHNKILFLKIAKKRPVIRWFQRTVKNHFNSQIINFISLFIYNTINNIIYSTIYGIIYNIVYDIIYSTCMILESECFYMAVKYLSISKIPLVCYWQLIILMWPVQTKISPHTWSVPSGHGPSLHCLLTTQFIFWKFS